jgi:hypothetical protein
METELKLLLTGADEARAVLCACGQVLQSLQQDNRYYDDAQLRWRAAGWSVRLRDETDGARTRHVLTVKGPAPQMAGSVFVQRGEWERDLDEPDARRARDGGDPLAALLGPLLAAGGAGPLPPPLVPRALAPLGVVHNAREVAALPGPGPSLEVEVDTSSYPDGSMGWEVELEMPPDASTAEQDAAVARLRRVFRRARVPWRPSTVTKLARFHASLRGPG